MNQGVADARGSSVTQAAVPELPSKAKAEDEEPKSKVKFEGNGQMITAMLLLINFQTQPPVGFVVLTLV